MKHTPTPWWLPCLCDDTSSCNCTSICEETYAGGICSVHVSNGISSVSEGGNDAPSKNEAKANAAFIVKSVNCHDDLLEALESAFIVLTTKTNEILTDMVVQQIKEALTKAKATS